MKKALIAWLFFQSGIAFAGEDRPSGSACGGLMTELECRQHRQNLADLQDPAARDEYLAKHAALMREREVMCACTREKVSLLRAHYR